jgi:hypothetical protein
MDDLQLAVESVLLDRATPHAAITLQAAVGDSTLTIWVGPLDGRPPAGEGRRREELEADRLLPALVERADVEDRLGERWLRIELRIPSRPR